MQACDLLSQHSQATNLDSLLYVFWCFDPGAMPAKKLSAVVAAPRRKGQGPASSASSSTARPASEQRSQSGAASSSSAMPPPKKPTKAVKGGKAAKDLAASGGNTTSQEAYSQLPPRFLKQKGRCEQVWHAVVHALREKLCPSSFGSWGVDAASRNHLCISVCLLLRCSCPRIWIHEDFHNTV